MNARQRSPNFSALLHAATEAKESHGRQTPSSTPRKDSFNGMSVLHLNSPGQGPLALSPLFGLSNTLSLPQSMLLSPMPSPMTVPLPPPDSSAVDALASAALGASILTSPSSVNITPRKSTHSQNMPTMSTSATGSSGPSTKKLKAETPAQRFDPTAPNSTNNATPKPKKQSPTPPLPSPSPSPLQLQLQALPGFGAQQQLQQQAMQQSGSDAAGGSSCHQCKSRRNFNDLTYCTSNLDKKKKSCRKKYCEHCLKKFYKETPAQVAAKPSWRCPSCRKICCCAACRRKETRSKGGSVNPASMSLSQLVNPLNLPMSLALGFGKLGAVGVGGPASSGANNTAALLKSALSQPPPKPMSVPIAPNVAPAQTSARPTAAGPSGPPTPLPSAPLVKSDSLSPSLPAAPNVLSTLPSSGPNHAGLVAFDAMATAAPTDSSESALGDLRPDSSVFLNFMGANTQAQNHCFALLFAVANLPNVNKHINYYLSRKDITDGQKVESIANLLRALSPPSAASGSAVASAGGTSTSTLPSSSSVSLSSTAAPPLPLPPTPTVFSFAAPRPQPSAALR